MTVVGKKLDNFQDKDTGRIIEYAKIFVTYPDVKTTGLVTEALSVKPELLQGLNIGDNINVSYNKYGKVQDIFLVQ